MKGNILWVGVSQCYLYAAPGHCKNRNMRVWTLKTQGESLLEHEMLRQCVVCQKSQGASAHAIAVGSVFLRFRTRRK